MGGTDADDFDWVGLVAKFIHPVQVAVIEALLYIDQPLSATDLVKVFDKKFDLSLASYHVTALAKKGTLAKVGDRRVRGSVESFYRIPR